MEPLFYSPNFDNSLRKINNVIKELEELEPQLQKSGVPISTYPIINIIKELNIIANQITTDNLSLDMLTDRRRKIQRLLAQFEAESQQQLLITEPNDDIVYYLLEVVKKLENLKASRNFNIPLIRKEVQETIKILNQILVHSSRFQYSDIRDLKQLEDMLTSLQYEKNFYYHEDIIELIRTIIRNLQENSDSYIQNSYFISPPISRINQTFTSLRRILDKLEENSRIYFSPPTLESSNVDVYLNHEFHHLEQQQETEERVGKRKKTTLLPMLIRVSDSSWNGNNIPDCQVISRLGDIIGCLGSRATLEALRNDPLVISVEASRSTDGWDNNYQRNGRQNSLFGRIFNWLTRVLNGFKKTLTNFFNSLNNSLNSRTSQYLSDSTGILLNPQPSSFVRITSANLVNEKYDEKGDAALIAIIDSGVDILHQAFLDSNGNSRIIAVWDQTDNTGSDLQIPEITPFGTKYTQDQIQDYIQTGMVPPNLRDNKGHGTHVASIAAGRPGGSFSGGIAPDAKIVVVIPNIQTRPNDNCSLGYSLSHVAALEYIKSVADKHKLPVVVNVSQGMNGGSHDGSSPLEISFDNFSGGGTSAGYVIVKSAGNERGNKNHAKLQMANNSSDWLSWYSSHGRYKAVIELWFDSGNTFKFSLYNPQNEESCWLYPGNEVNSSFANQDRYQMSYVRCHRDNGDSRLLITLSSRNSSTYIAEGEWILKIESLEITSEKPIHAWIERDLQRGIYFTSHVSEETTLSVPGTARTVISVGSVNNNRPFKVSPYSSYGPTRDDRKKPEIATPGESIIGALAGSDSDFELGDGTSFAAPQVAGAIALILSFISKQSTRHPSLEQLNAVQMNKLICQAAQNYDGHWHPGMGFGVLDVDKLFSILPYFYSNCR